MEKYISDIRKIPLDITIKCNDGELKGCKALLSARNDYFNKMFNGNFKETSEISIDENCLIAQMLLDNIQYNSDYTFSYFYKHNYELTFDCSCNNNSCSHCKSYKLWKEDSLKEIPILIKYLIYTSTKLMCISTMSPTFKVGDAVNII